MIIDSDKLILDELFEYGYALIALAAYRLRAAEEYQAEWDSLQTVIDLLIEQKTNLLIKHSNKIKGFENV